MEEITINGVVYEVIKNNNNAIDISLLTDKITDFYDGFDYIVGDWAYGKIRLKGFYDSNHPNRKDYNDITRLEEYIKNNCAYGCKWFQIKKKRN